MVLEILPASGRRKAGNEDAVVGTAARRTTAEKKRFLFLLADLVGIGC